MTIYRVIISERSRDFREEEGFSDEVFLKEFPSKEKVSSIFAERGTKIEEWRQAYFEAAHQVKNWKDFPEVMTTCAEIGRSIGKDWYIRIAKIEVL